MIDTAVKRYQQLSKDVIRHLYNHGVLTLLEMSRLCNKSLPVITAVVHHLIEVGYLKESGLAHSTGGRRPSTFLLNPERKSFIVAVILDQLTVQMQIYDLLNREQGSVQTMLFRFPGSDKEFEELRQFIQKNIMESGILTEQFLGIGVGIPGFSYLYDSDKLKRYLTETLGLPVFVDKDANLTARAELKFGLGKGYREIMVINFDSQISLGMIIQGKSFRGYKGGAGAFGHMPISRSDQLCSCGKRGCLNVEAALPALVERARKEMSMGTRSKMEELFNDRDELPAEQLLRAAKGGDPLAVSILSDAGYLIGKGLSTLIHIMNPELIVLSGRGAMAGKILMAPIQQAINEYCIPELAEQTTIVISEMAGLSVFLGAVTLVVENCTFN